MRQQAVFHQQPELKTFLRPRRSCGRFPGSSWISTLGRMRARGKSRSWGGEGMAMNWGRCRLPNLREVGAVVMGERRLLICFYGSVRVPPAGKAPSHAPSCPPKYTTRITEVTAALFCVFDRLPLDFQLDMAPFPPMMRRSALAGGLCFCAPVGRNSTPRASRGSLRVQCRSKAPKLKMTHPLDGA